MAASPSITATNAGNVEHARVSLGGPVFLFLQFFGYAVVVGALLVFGDSMRRPASDFGGAGARRWAWAVPQLLLLALIAVGWILSLLDAGPREVLAALGGFLTFYLFLCAILQIAYLLVVVFPRRREHGGADATGE